MMLLGGRVFGTACKEIPESSIAFSYLKIQRVGTGFEAVAREPSPEPDRATLISDIPQSPEL